MNTEATPTRAEPTHHLSPPGPPPEPEPSGGAHGAKPDQGIPERMRRLNWPVAAIVLLGAFSIPIWRTLTNHAAAKTPLPAAVTSQAVEVTQVTRQDLYNQITIPAEFRPYLQVELHAKVSGYVSEITVDIGDKVKTGQLLAKLEVPELQSELEHASATEEHAKADYKDAHLAYTRLLKVEEAHPNLVAQQELDAAEAKDATTGAALAAAKADVERYRTLLAYTRITAPFDGVVTRRYADPGSLIQAGTASATQSLPLVRLSDNYRLRLDFPVSVTYVKDIHLGDPVEVRVDSLHGKTFSGTISRFSRKVDDDTRTMIAEIEVPNSDLELVPGMYATLTLSVERHPKALTVPVEAVATGRTPEVYLVNAKDELEQRLVTLGLETPTHYEVLSGLKEGDLVTLGNRSQLRPGQKVKSKLISSLAKQ
jgi:RND family efflux transporter MFP subunit